MLFHLASFCLGTLAGVVGAFSLMIWLSWSEQPREVRENYRVNKCGQRPADWPL